MEIQKHGFVLMGKGEIMMTDREKVINVLEWIVDDIEENGHYHVRYYAGEIRKVLDLLKEQEPSGWISVKDRLPVRPSDVCGLPVRRQWYLVALESGAVLTLSYEFDEDRWQGVGTPVTHWMPLPQAPKEVTRDENC